MGKRMVKEYLLFLEVESMKVNTRIGENMAKEHTHNIVPSFTLMGESMLGNTRMGKSRMEYITTKTRKKNTSW